MCVPAAPLTPALSSIEEERERGQVAVADRADRRVPCLPANPRYASASEITVSRRTTYGTVWDLSRCAAG